jgi:diguanylate cyclase (GGDEF)-like protein
MVATIGDPARARAARELLEDYCPLAAGDADLDGTDGVLLASDSATWVAVGVAIGAATLALIASLVVLLVVPRGRRSSYAAVEQLLRESLERTQGLHGDLAAALEEARAETQRARELGEISATIDLDAVLARTLETAGASAGVDAGVIRIQSPEGSSSDPILAAIGMSTEEAAGQPAADPPGGQPARAVRIAYAYTHDQSREDGDLIHGGVSIPLRDGDGEPIGTLTVFWRGEAREATDSEVAALEELATRAGPAIENARRFREARQLADLDALTTLHNRGYFHETLTRECSRAHRYDRELALVVFDIDDFKAINDRIGHLAGDSVLAGVAERLQSVVRRADIACRVGGDEFAVILPESKLEDAEQLYRRVQFAVGARPIGPFERLHLSAGIAQLRSDDDATSFFERADEALYRAKEAGKGQFIAADGLG